MVLGPLGRRLESWFGLGLSHGQTLLSFLDRKMSEVGKRFGRKMSEVGKSLGRKMSEVGKHLGREMSEVGKSLGR